MKKKLVSLMLVLATTVSMTACGGNTNAGNAGSNAGNAGSSTEDAANAGSDAVDSTEAGEAGAEASYDEESAKLYNDNLGDFYSTYEEAKAADNLSERYALMAVAEAKLMESAVMLPFTTKGGMYAISHVAPYTAPYVLWGNDYERYHIFLLLWQCVFAIEARKLPASFA